MSLGKSIANRKERRKPYRGAKAIDRTCRNHGNCGKCRGNRMYGNDKRELRVRQELEECDARIEKQFQKCTRNARPVLTIFQDMESAV